MTLRLLTAVAALVIFGTNAHAMKDTEKTRLITGIIASHIIPRFVALEASARELHATIDARCAANQSLGDEKLRQAFTKALSASMGIQHLRFGPTMTDDRLYRMQYGHDKNRAERQVRKLLSLPLEKIPDAGQIAQRSIAIQGLPALEVLLFAAPGQDAAMDRARCRLAGAISGNLVSLAEQTVSDWRQYQVQDLQETVDRMIHAVVEQLQTIAGAKLNRVLGPSAGEARPKRAENWRSGMSFDNIRQNYLALSELIEGVSGKPGLNAALQGSEEEKEAGAAISEHLGYAARAIAQHDETLAEAVTTGSGRKFTAFLMQHTNGTLELMAEHLAPALDVKLGFNSLDGD